MGCRAQNKEPESTSMIPKTSYVAVCFRGKRAREYFVWLCHHDVEGVDKCITKVIPFGLLELRLGTLNL